MKNKEEDAVRASPHATGLTIAIEKTSPQLQTLKIFQNLIKITKTRKPAVEKEAIMATLEDYATAYCA